MRNLDGSVTAPGTPSGLGWVCTACDIVLLLGGLQRSPSRSARLAPLATPPARLAAGMPAAAASISRILRRTRLRVSHQLLLEPAELIAAVAHELELAVDVPERLLQQLAPAHRVTSSRRSCARTAARASSAASSVFSSSSETPSRFFSRITSRSRSTSSSL